jgi:hypothetical protein
MLIRSDWPWAGGASGSFVVYIVLPSVPLYLLYLLLYRLTFHELYAAALFAQLMAWCA